MELISIPFEISLLREFADMMNLPVFIINGLNFTALCSLLFQIQAVCNSVFFVHLLNGMQI